MEHKGNIIHHKGKGIIENAAESTEDEIAASGGKIFFHSLVT